MRLSLCAFAAVMALGCSKDKAGSAGAEGGASAASPLPALGAFLTGFEGEIDAFMKDASGPPTSVAVFVKAGKLRFDVPEKLSQGGPAMMLGPKAYVIFDSAGKKIDLVADSRKEVIVIDLEKSGQELKGLGAPPAVPHGPQAPGPQGPPTKLTKTGKTDTVAGYSCDLWDVTSDHREGTICVAQEGASWFSIPLGGLPTEHAWALELLDGKHFPLRFVGYQPDGTTEKSRLEVTKIDKKTLPPTEFEYPPTYKVVDIAQLFAPMAHFGGGMPGGMPMGMPGMPAGPPPAHPHH